MLPGLDSDKSSQISGKNALVALFALSKNLSDETCFLSPIPHSYEIIVVY